MAEANSAPTERAVESRRTRDWASLIADVPYYAIVVLGLIGIFWTTLFRAPATTYWVILNRHQMSLSVA
jgi:hypothetical protein